MGAPPGTTSAFWAEGEATEAAAWAGEAGPPATAAVVAGESLVGSHRRYQSKRVGRVGYARDLLGLWGRVLLSDLCLEFDELGWHGPLRTNNCVSSKPGQETERRRTDRGLLRLLQEHARRDRA